MKLLILIMVVMFAAVQVQTVQAGEFSATVGAGIAYSPDYEGSDDYDFSAVPIVVLGWEIEDQEPRANNDFRIDLHDVSLSAAGLQAGVVRYYRPEGLYKLNLGLGYNGGRDDADNKALRGMGDIKGHATGSVGVAFEAADSGWMYGATFTQDLSDETEGSTADFYLGYALPVATDLTLSTVAATTWADDDYMQSYFGVTRKQAAASSNAQFAAESGFKSAGLSMGLDWNVHKNWVVSSSVGYARLLGDAADSPLVKKQGSANQFSSFLGVTYNF